MNAKLKEMDRARIRMHALCAALALAVLAVYSNHFENGFHFDDIHTIITNPAIGSPRNIPRFFTDAALFSSRPEARSWRPLVSTSLAIDYWLGGGLKPFYFHLTTFICFEVLLLLMFFLYRRLMDQADPHRGNIWTELLAAACYGLHPVAAETVNYIIQRADLYVALGTVASVLWFAACPNQRRYGWYLLPAIAAFLSKATGFTYPLILLAYVWLFEQDARAGKWGAALRATLPAFAVTIAAVILTWKLTPATFNAGADSPELYRLTQPLVALYYFKCLFLPTALSADSEWHYVTSPVSGPALAGYVFIAALVAAVAFAARRREMRPIALGLLWFLIALLPTSLMALADVTNDHRMFFPFVGLALAVFWSLRLALFHLTSRLTMRRGWLHGAVAGVAIVLAAASLATRERNEVWRTEESLWHDVTLKNPHNGRGMLNYGLVLLGEHQYARALPYLERARPDHPDSAALEIAVAQALNGLNREAEAEAHYKKALTLDAESDDYSPRMQYADWLRRKGRAVEAEKQLEADIEDDGDEIRIPEEALARSGECCREGEYGQCLLMARRALTLRPRWAEAYNAMATAYLALERWDAGTQAAREALQIKPDYQDAKRNLAWGLAHEHR